MFFNLFGKSSSGDQQAIHDIVYSTTQAKFQALTELLTTDSTVLVVAWFQDTFHQLQEFVQAANQSPDRVVLYRQVETLHGNHRLVFAEHYPLQEKEAAVFGERMNQGITVYSALDEPLFLYFGADKMKPMLAMLGLKSGEAISHKMVTQAIARGQEKIAGLVQNDFGAQNQADWMNKHLPVKD